jgi:hypothetical protein
LFEKLGVKTFVCVENFDPDEAVVFPVEGDESVDPGGSAAAMVVRPASIATSVRWM